MINLTLKYVVEEVWLYIINLIGDERVIVIYYDILIEIDFLLN